MRKFVVGTHWNIFGERLKTYQLINFELFIIVVDSPIILLKWFFFNSWHETLLSVVCKNQLIYNQIVELNYSSNKL